METEVASNLWYKIRWMREMSGKCPGEVARSSGISERDLTAIEEGSDDELTSMVIIRLCDAIGCDLSDLVSGPQWPPKSRELHRRMEPMIVEIQRLLQVAGRGRRHLLDHTVRALLSDLSYSLYEEDKISEGRYREALAVIDDAITSMPRRESWE